MNGQQPSPTIEWLERLGFFGIHLGLERMNALVGRLKHPERSYPSIHVVGTNGKTTVTRTIEALLMAEGLSVGTYTSPHVTEWSERIRVDGQDADFERAIARVRPAAEALGATQFEVLTAAGLLEFAASAVDAAVVEAGLGGRLDATNVVGAKVAVLTNIALEHVEYLGATREAIAEEKLAVIASGATVVLGEPEWEERALAHGASRVIAAPGGNADVACAAAEAFLDKPVDRAVAERVVVPGRYEQVGYSPLEIWDGAHNVAGVAYLCSQLPERDWVLVLSMLADKNTDRMLAAFSPLGDRVIATSSGHTRALEAEELARRARTYFPRAMAIEDPPAARAHALRTAGPDGAVLISGSLYLLADLAAVRTANVRWGT